MELFTIYRFQEVVSEECTRYDIEADSFEEAIKKFNKALDQYSAHKYHTDRITIRSTVKDLHFEDNNGNKIERVY